MGGSYSLPWILQVINNLEKMGKAHLGDVMSVKVVERFGL